MLDQSFSGLLAKLTDHSEPNRAFQCTDGFVSILREQSGGDCRVGTGTFEDPQSPRATFLDNPQSIITGVDQHGLNPGCQLLDPFVGHFLREASDELLGSFFGKRRLALRGCMSP